MFPMMPDPLPERTTPFVPPTSIELQIIFDPTRHYAIEDVKLVETYAVGVHSTQLSDGMPALNKVECRSEQRPGFNYVESRLDWSKNGNTYAVFSRNGELGAVFMKEAEALHGSLAYSPWDHWSELAPGIETNMHFIDFKVVFKEGVHSTQLSDGLPGEQINVVLKLDRPSTPLNAARKQPPD